MKKLTALFDLPELKDEIELHNMVLDSRKVKTEDLFVAIKGHQVDGNQFIDSAIHSGASAVISETELSSEHLTVTFIGNVPVVKFYQLARHLSSLADIFYDSPSKKINACWRNRDKWQDYYFSIISTMGGAIRPSCSSNGNNW